MALTIASGSWQFLEGTSSTTLTRKITFDQIKQGAMCLWFQVNNYPDTSFTVNFLDTQFQGTPLFKVNTSSPNPFIRVSYVINGTTFSTTAANPYPTSPTHVALTWDQVSGVQKVYTNGVLVNTVNATGSIFSTNHTFGFGIDFTGNPGTGIASDTSITFQDLVVFSGYTPTINDILSLTNRTKLPTQIGPAGPSGAAYWYTLNGPPGSSAKLNNIGLTNSGYTQGVNLYYQNIPQNNGLTPTGMALYDTTTLIYTYALAVSGAYISTNSGLAVFLFNQTNNGQYSYANQLISSPTFTVTYPGFNKTFTPTNAISSIFCPWIMFTLPSAIPSNATVTYSIPTGMITTQAGTINATTGYFVNNIGKDVFIYPSSDNVNIGFNIYANVYYGNQFCFKNYAFRAARSPLGPFGVVNIGDDQQPLSSTGNVTNNLWYTGDNQIDNRKLPFTTGIWNISWQDDPTNSSLVKVFSFTGNSNVSNGTFTSVVISGIRYSTQQHSITYTNIANNFTPDLWEQVIPYNTGSINVRNLWIIPPGNSLDTSNPGALDQNIIEKISTNSGKFCPIIRGMTGLGTNNSNIVIPSHFSQITGYTWGHLSSLKNIYPAIIRPYNLSVSPSAYFENYGWVFPSSINYLYVIGSNNGRWCFEGITSGNHGLYTGQNLQIFTSPQFLQLPVTGDNQIYTVGGSGGAITLNLGRGNVVVTGPSSFVFYGFQGGLSSATGVDVKTLINSYTSGISIQQDIYNNLGVYGVPPEAYVRASASLSGTICWYNIPHAVTDVTATIYAQTAFNNYPSGRLLLVELSNEHWNSSFIQWAYYWTLGGLNNTSSDIEYVKRANQIHNIFDAVFNSGGRPNSIIRFFGSRYTSPTTTNTIITTCLNNGFPIHAIGIAPYMNTADDPSVLNAIVSGSMLNTHEIFRHYLWYNNIDPAFAASVQSSINSYKNITGSGIDIYGYEGSIQKPTYNSYSGALSLSDFNYNPEMYRSMLHYFRWLQNTWNMKTIAYFQLEDYLAGNDNPSYQSWEMITYPSQQWGKGDGSDGKVVNKFALNDGLPHDYDNISPAILAWKDYTNMNTGIPSYIVNPIVIAENPSSGSVGLTGSQGLSVTFSKAIVPSSVKFIIKDQNNRIVNSTITYADNFTTTASVTTGLSSASGYTITISGAVDTVGITQNNTFSYQVNFSVLPIVVNYYPSVSSTNIPIITPIYITFSGPINSGGLSFSVVDSSGLSSPGVTTYNSGLYQESFVGSFPLNFLRNYTVSLTGVYDPYGRFVGSFSWPFETYAVPTNSLNKKYIVKLGEPLNFSQITILLN